MLCLRFDIVDISKTKVDEIIIDRTKVFISHDTHVSVSLYLALSLRSASGYGKVPEHASIARRQQGIFVGRKEKYMKNVNIIRYFPKWIRKFRLTSVLLCTVSSS